MRRTRVRADTATHRELERLAKEFDTSASDAVALAARRLRQDQIGSELRAELTEAEVEWLDAADASNGLDHESAAK